MNEEVEYFRKIAESLRSDIEKTYEPGNVRRDAHPKNIACVKAEFKIEPQLPEELRISIQGATDLPRIHSLLKRVHDDSVR